MQKKSHPSAKSRTTPPKLSRAAGQIRDPPVLTYPRPKVLNLSGQIHDNLKTHTGTPSTRRPGSSVLAWLREVNFMPATGTRKRTPIETLPLEERIRWRAHELYVLRGNQSGSELDDWLQAEEEIRRATDQAIDEASEESFPASDPPTY